MGTQRSSRSRGKIVYKGIQTCYGFTFKRLINDNPSKKKVPILGEVPPFEEPMLGLPERLQARGGKEEELYTRVSVDQDLKNYFLGIL